MPKVIGIVYRDDGSDFKVVDGADVKIRGTKDLTGVTIASGDLLLMDDITVSSGDADGTEDSTGRIQVSQLATYMETGLSTLTVDDILLNGKVIQVTGDTDDTFTITTGANGETTLETVDNAAAAGHLNIEADGHVEFDNCAVGFDRILAEDATNVEIDFTTGNKAHLDMTNGSISGTLTLKFPATSGNFVLVVEQDTSTRTIAAFATKDAAGNAGNNDGGTGGAIRWAGGSAPDLTDGGNKRDVLSFYWDADEGVCYGVASLNF